MAKHEFRIMNKEPSANERFNAYEPDKYNYLAVDDDFIEPILFDLRCVDCYWHTLQRAGKGLAYYGITLIPPDSMDAFIRILSSQNKEEYIYLIFLANQTKDHRKYMIHFGI